jgi:hypothetical protein
MVAMNLTQQIASGGHRNSAAWFAVTRILVLFLLCAVPILSTIAKDSVYLPQSNTAHFINIAAKMKVSDVPVVLSQPQIVEPLTPLEFPEPEIRTTRQDQLEVPPVPKVSLSVCLQHRSPPFIFS